MPLLRLLPLVVDNLMPDLRDTELRVLLVVLNQTIGRSKQDDWLSHSQLKARTGRASEAVSAAIDQLVQRGLIQVRSETGFVLDTAAARRREHHQLRYSLGRHLLHLERDQIDPPSMLSARPVSRASAAVVATNGKPKTTENIYKENSRFRKIERSESLEKRAADTVGHQERIEAAKQRIRTTLRIPGDVRNGQ